jgi:hypothetical protein
VKRTNSPTASYPNSIFMIWCTLGGRRILLSGLIFLCISVSQAMAGANPVEKNSLSVKWDPLTGAPLTIRGKKSPLLIIGNISRLSRDQITRVGPMLVKKYAPLLKIRPEDLRFKAAERISGSWYLSYWQTFKGTIIYESSLGFSIDPDGRVDSLGALLYPGVRVPGKNRIDREEALKTAQDQVPDFKKFEYRLLAESTIIYPERKADKIIYHRVYAFNFFPRKALHPASAVGGWAVLVDTQTGRPVRVETLFRPMGCCVPENWTPPKTEDDYKGILGE